jgi:copper(I)-binding protein
MPKAGWTIAIEKSEYAHPYKMHGKSVTSGVKAITWKGDLPDAYFDEFSINGSFAGVKEGDRLFFKTVQTCDSGRLAWTQEAAPGQNPHGLEHPAPFVTIAAEISGHAMGHDHAMGMDMSMGGKHAAMAGDIAIKDAHARAMLPGQPTGAGYLTIVNGGKEADRLVSVTSPAAGKVEVHEMKTENGVMKMRAVEGGLEVPAGGSVELQPGGGYHLMFEDMEKPFAKGDSVPVTLEFEKAGKVEVTLPVGPASGGMGHMDHD